MGRDGVIATLIRIAYRLNELFRSGGTVLSRVDRKRGPIDRRRAERTVLNEISVDTLQIIG